MFLYQLNYNEINIEYSHFKINKDKCVCWHSNNGLIVCSERQKAMKAPSFRYTSPQLSFQKHDGLYFKDFSLKNVLTFNTLVDVDYLTILLVRSNYFLLHSFDE